MKRLALGMLMFPVLAAILISGRVISVSGPLPEGFCGGMDSADGKAACLSYWGPDDDIVRNYLLYGDTLIGDAERLDALVKEENGLVSTYNSARGEGHGSGAFLAYVGLAERFAAEGEAAGSHIASSRAFLKGNSGAMQKRGMDSGMLENSVNITSRALIGDMGIVRDNIGRMRGNGTLTQEGGQRADAAVSRLDGIVRSLEN